jgi:hypothetical protein
MERVKLTADKTIYVGIPRWYLKLWNLVRYGRPNGRPGNPLTSVAEAFGDTDPDLGGYTLTVNITDNEEPHR